MKVKPNEADLPKYEKQIEIALPDINNFNPIINIQNVDYTKSIKR